MKMLTKCPMCNSLEDEADDHLYELELTEEKVYEFTCKEGHENVLVLRNHSFEMLFEMGLYALNDGYSREAAANFAVAIERFHEFSIAVFAHEHGGEQSDSSDVFRIISQTFDDEYQNSWKAISKQSERQYGAYIMLYLITFKRTPILMKDKYITFRNDVTHKGIFPSRVKTEKYARATFDYIKTKLLELKTIAPKSVDYVFSKELRDFKEGQIERYNGKVVVDYRINTSLRVDCTLEEINNKNFDSELEDASSYPFFKREIR